ncbi:hypothetical protein [Nocardia sp. NPDC004860]|uniref:sensor histidine kinase n=1 Tax=Nocardia sp. NPDC004860 TaxID=3154557 RepID=UPI0033B17539
MNSSTVSGAGGQEELHTDRAKLTEGDDTARVLRLISRFIGFGYLGYLVLLFKCYSPESAYLASWWTPMALVVLYGPPVVLIGLSFRTGTVALRRWGAVVAVSYVILLLTWPVAWGGELLPDSPWIATIPGLAALAAAIAWQPRAVLAYLFVAVTLAQALCQARQDSVRSPFVLDWLFSWGFCLPYVAGTLMCMYTARLLDDSRERAYIAAAKTEIVRKHESDRAVLNDFLHGGVIFCLNAAAHRRDPAKVREYAHITLRRLDHDMAQIGTGLPSRRMTFAEVVDYLRQLTAAVDDTATFEVTSITGEGRSEYDSRVVEALGLSLAEVLRNSVRHAGPGARRRVGVGGDSASLSLTAVDDGRGFDVATTTGFGSQQVRDWMRLIPGGKCVVHSTPGHGVRVELSWTDPRITNGAEPSDVRELLGMNNRWAWLVTGFFLVGILAQATGALMLVRAEPVWPVVVAMGLLVTSSAVLLLVPGDPLPPAATLFLGLAGPAAVAVVLLAPPVDGNIHLLWSASGFTAVCTFMCVRGRTTSAWLAMTAMVGVAGIWSSMASGHPWPGIGSSLVNYAPLAMATFFAGTIRPAARTIFELWDTAQHEFVQTAVATEALNDRNAELRELGRFARPSLVRIADDAPYSEEETLEFARLSRQLRDSLRAFGLVHPILDGVVEAARRRGVTVLMFDEQGMDDIVEETRRRVLYLIAEELDRLPEGQFAVRIVPPGRPQLATVTAYSGTKVRLLQFDREGCASEVALTHAG